MASPLIEHPAKSIDNATARTQVLQNDIQEVTIFTPVLMCHNECSRMIMCIAGGISEKLTCIYTNEVGWVLHGGNWRTINDWQGCVGKVIAS